MPNDVDLITDPNPTSPPFEIPERAPQRAPERPEIRRDPDEETLSGLSGLAIKHPHLIVVACLFVLILGGLSLFLLPKDLLPAANLPAVQIMSFYAGMPVEHVEQDLTERLERYTGQGVGLERQQSRSLTGVSIIRNFFGPQIELSDAMSQTTSLVMSALRKLPPGTQPPLILPFDPMAATPLALVAVGGDFPEKTLYDAARYDVRNAIQSVPGAMAPTVMGGTPRQAIVYLSSDGLKRFNFSPVQVMQKLSGLNTFIPAGDVKIGDYDYQIVSNGLVDQLDRMNQFPLRSQNGVTVKVNDVGKAADAQQIQTNVVAIDGKRQVYVPVYRQPGANSIQVVDDVRASLSRLAGKLPGYALNLVADQSIFIRKAIESITDEALIGGGLAALMVLLFLGSPRAMSAICLSIPLSIFCAFLGLKAAGQTLNAMTLGGLALSIGVLVDNSIVVIENIMKKTGEGMSARRAAVEGAREVGMPVLASTLATLVVFFPIAFLSGIVKILFSALAKAVIFAMIGSYLVAMTVIPLFTARFLKHAGHAKGGMIGLVQRGLRRLTDQYGHALEWALHRRKIVVPAVAVCLVALALSLVGRIGTELFPRADAGGFILTLRGPSGLRIEKTEALSRGIQASLRRWIAPSDLKTIIANAGVYYGFPAAFTPNAGSQDVFFNVELTENRKHTSQYYARIIRQELPKAYPGMEFGVQLGGLLTSALNGGLPAPIDIQVTGPKLEKSHELADGLTRALRTVPGATDVRVQQRFDSPQIDLDIDRAKAVALGLTPDQVVKNVVSATTGSTTFNPAIWIDPRNGIDYNFGVQYREDAIAKFGDLLSIPITSKEQDRSVPLSRLASARITKGPSEVNHVNLEPVIDIYLDAQDRDVGGLSRDVEKTIAQAHLPAGYEARIRGEISEMEKSVGLLGGGFLLAAVLVYLILVVQFRSYLIPAIVMVTVPMGLVGIIAMLALTGTYFSIQAAIGAIFMIGIAVANGVLLIEFILHHAKAGGDLSHAIIAGSQARLRPILMTSLASILGLVPMAIGLGHGSEANIPLGRSVIGGQLLSTTLTLFMVPCLFRLLVRIKPEPTPAAGYLAPREGWA